jgi:hemolysin activation/secretion protein
MSLTGLLLLLSLSKPSIQLSAAPVPDAGSILRDQQQSQKQPQVQFPLSEKAKEPPVNTGSNVKVVVKGFTFSGYDGLVTEAELQELLAGSIGKSLSFEELNVLTDRVTALFKAKGWLQARAYLPPQDITSGIIRMVISQVKSDGNLTIKRDKSARICPDYLHGIGMSALHAGKPIKELELERNVLLMNDLPGVSAKASLVPGSEPGTSGVAVAVTEGRLFSGMLYGDNQGNRYVGTWRGSAMVSVNDPFRHGDQLTLLLTEASGLAQGRIGYSVPIAFSGVRANLSYTAMRYELGRELGPLQYKGNSNSINAGISYPMLRTRNANVITSFSYGYRGLIDTQADVNIHDKQINSATLMVSGDRYDKLYGGGYTSYNASITRGSLHESSDLTAEYARTNLTEGSYIRFNFGLARLQHLSERVNLNISGSAQMADGNLDSSEKFTLGGPNGVRAYPIGEAAGDEGQLLSAEIRYALPLAAKSGNLQLIGFYDAGHITINNERYPGDLSTATDRNKYWLLGVGAGLNYAYSARFSVRGIWAHVIGDNAGRSTVGNNSDDLNDRSRFWLQSTFSF